MGPIGIQETKKLKLHSVIAKPISPEAAGWICEDIWSSDLAGKYKFLVHQKREKGNWG